MWGGWDDPCARATRALGRASLDARSGGLIQAILEKHKRASLEDPSLIAPPAALLGTRRVLGRRGWLGRLRAGG